MNAERITETKPRKYSYNQTLIIGRCAPDVTYTELKQKFCDSYFGGSVSIKDGEFTVVAFGSD